MVMHHEVSEKNLLPFDCTASLRSEVMQRVSPYISLDLTKMAPGKSIIKDYLVLTESK